MLKKLLLAAVATGALANAAFAQDVKVLRIGLDGSENEADQIRNTQCVADGLKAAREVFLERMILCFIEDDFGARHAREIGTNRICFETDYPHSDAIWPNAPERLMQGFAPTDLTDDEINEMTHRNAMRCLSCARTQSFFTAEFIFAVTAGIGQAMDRSAC